MRLSWTSHPVRVYTACGPISHRCTRYRHIGTTANEITNYEQEQSGMLPEQLKNLQEYHAELFFAWRRMDVRAFTAVLLTVMKAALTVIIFLTARDLRHMGLLFNLSFAVTYVASATILILTFYRARPVAGLIGNVDRLEGAVTRQAAR